jgi:hypothetical protein
VLGRAAAGAPQSLLDFRMRLMRPRQFRRQLRWSALRTNPAQSRAFAPFDVLRSIQRIGAVSLIVSSIGETAAHGHYPSLINAEGSLSNERLV